MHKSIFGGTPVDCTGRIGSLDARHVPILDRAWTHQEFLLSPRIIRYLESSIELCCPAGTQSHDGLQQLAQSRHWPLGRNPRLPLPLYGGTVDLVPLEERKSWVAKHWYHIVEAYSTAETSLPDDKLPALAGVAAVIQQAIGGAYYAGMWGVTLHTDLLWISGIANVGRPVRISKGQSDLNVEVARKFRIPSWSWAYSNEPKNFRFCRDVSGHFGLRSAKSTCRVVKCSVRLVEIRLPYGMVDGGCLIIRGYIKALSLETALMIFGPKIVEIHTDRSIRTMIGIASTILPGLTMCR